MTGGFATGDRLAKRVAGFLLLCFASFCRTAGEFFVLVVFLAAETPVVFVGGFGASDFLASRVLAGFAAGF